MDRRAGPDSMCGRVKFSSQAHDREKSRQSLPVGEAAPTVTATRRRRWRGSGEGRNRECRKAQRLGKSNKPADREEGIFRWRGWTKRITQQRP